MQMKGSFMGSVSLGSIMTYMIESFKDVITANHYFNRSQYENEVQVENKDIAVLPGELDQLNSVTKENAGWHSVKGSCLPMEYNRFTDIHIILLNDVLSVVS